MGSRDSGLPLAAPERGRRALITGGAGFIGSHLCRRLRAQGVAVRLFDNLSRPGSELRWAALGRQADSRLELVQADIRDAGAVGRAVQGCSEVYHLAAQVAVTQSLADPRTDFEINALGTLHVLEAARRLQPPPFLLFTSTNKVYGALRQRLEEPRDGRWRLRPEAVNEDQPLDFHSPYGCSKGAADQYVRDYARIFALPAVVFRMSCIYGPGQWGSEDQGWVAYFARAAWQGAPLTIYGDGRQVRDLLYIDDLLEAMDLAWRRRRELVGQVFNIGGGPRNARSLWEVAGLLQHLLERQIPLVHGPWRVGDQRAYCSDTERFSAATGWQPRVGVEAGLRRLRAWLEQEEDSARRSVAA